MYVSWGGVHGAPASNKTRFFLGAHTSRRRFGTRRLLTVDDPLPEFPLVIDAHTIVFSADRCIAKTFLEVPVRFVAEECAMPMYNCLLQACTTCFCSGGAEANVENARQVSVQILNESEESDRPLA